MKVFDPGLRKVAVALFTTLNTPVSLSQLILLRYQEWDQLATRKLSPVMYLEGSIGAERFRRDSQAINFLRKSPLLPTTIDRKKKAVESFLDSEKRCFTTNKLMELLHYPMASDDAIFGRMRQVLQRARKIVGRILGPIPDGVDGRFGPGTSFELKGNVYSTSADKLWTTPHVTQDCRALFEHMFWPTHWGRRRLELGLPLPATCRGNRFTTVAKDASTDRGICIEPLGNLWVQLGIGSYLKGRLARVGIYVDRRSEVDTSLITNGWRRNRARPYHNGSEIHRRLAQVGSETGELATIDLSSASDTVALEVVRAVLPPDWFDLLYACRSPYTLVNKSWHRLEKFSSMGNGYTFELETLIFLGLLAGGIGLKVGSELRCYGDDIILPAVQYREALAILECFGFQPNSSKSFGEGPFRESCGGDFFSGWPVRSVYAKAEYSSPLEWMALHNQLVKAWGNTLASRRCVDNVPSSFRLYGPVTYGDSVLHSSDRRRWRSWHDNGCEWIHTLAATPTIIKHERWGSEFTLTSALLGASSRGLTPRDEIDGYRKVMCSVS